MMATLRNESAIPFPIEKKDSLLFGPCQSLSVARYLEIKSGCFA